MTFAVVTKRVLEQLPVRHQNQKLTRYIIKLTILEVERMIVESITDYDNDVANKFVGKKGLKNA